MNSVGIDHGAVGEDLEEHAELAAVVRSAQGHSGQERVGRGHRAADAWSGRQRGVETSPELASSGVDGPVRDRPAGRSWAGGAGEDVAGGMNVLPTDAAEADHRAMDAGPV